MNIFFTAYWSAYLAIRHYRLHSISSHSNVRVCARMCARVCCLLLIYVCLWILRNRKINTWRAYRLHIHVQAASKESYNGLFPFRAFVSARRKKNGRNAEIGVSDNDKIKMNMINYEKAHLPAIHFFLCRGLACFPLFATEVVKTHTHPRKLPSRVP